MSGPDTKSWNLTLIEGEHESLRQEFRRSGFSAEKIASKAREGIQKWIALGRSVSDLDERESIIDICEHWNFSALDGEMAVYLGPLPPSPESVRTIRVSDPPDEPSAPPFWALASECGLSARRGSASEEPRYTVFALRDVLPSAEQTLPEEYREILQFSALDAFPTGSIYYAVRGGEKVLRNMITVTLWGGAAAGYVSSGDLWGRAKPKSVFGPSLVASLGIDLPDPEVGSLRRERFLTDLVADPTESSGPCEIGYAAKADLEDLRRVGTACNLLKELLNE